MDEPRFDGNCPNCGGPIVTALPNDGRDLVVETCEHCGNKYFIYTGEGFVPCCRKG